MMRREFLKKDRPVVDAAFASMALATVVGQFFQSLPLRHSEFEFPRLHFTGLEPSFRFDCG
jgi:hypothetical protein